MKKHWIFLGVGIIMGMIISISINYYKSQKPFTFLKMVSNSNGLMRYPCLDTEELTKYTGDEVRDILFNELAQRAKDKVVGGRFIEDDRDLCRALIDKCQSQGVRLLAGLYAQYPGNDVRWVIAESFADRQRTDAFMYVVAGIMNETEGYLLLYIDESLSRLTNEKPYYKQGQSDDDARKNRGNLYIYWCQYIPKYK
ncbi:MAG: hypothetical protein HZA49_01990 [Planctomycetes bacterium]|nr:hypothetical protein [Planctomycetota bacterium]